MKATAHLLCFACALSACSTPPTSAPRVDFARENAAFETRLRNTDVEGGVRSRIPGPQQASLWSPASASLISARRVNRIGDTLTVLISINDQAEFSNSMNRSTSAGEELGIPQLLGIPQRLNERLPTGSTLDNAVSVSSSSSTDGSGSVKRNERLQLKVAATVTEELPNDVLRIEGSQEITVNFETRILTVAGYVKKMDVTRNNEVSYEKITLAQVSYGGAGSVVQTTQPRYGQRVLNNVLPF